MDHDAFGLKPESEIDMLQRERVDETLFDPKDPFGRRFLEGIRNEIKLRSLAIGYRLMHEIKFQIVQYN